MLRAFLAVVACMLLSGCWVSEKHLFGPGDWAHLGIAGKYDVENMLGGDGPSGTILTTRPDGLIQSVPIGDTDGSEQHTLSGMVAIPGGSGQFFLTVNQSDDDGDDYYIARRSLDGRIALFMPDCAGTSAREGLVIEKESKGGLTCVFASRAALLDAALEAERFLSSPHIIAVAPLYELVPIEEVEAADEQE